MENIELRFEVLNAIKAPKQQVEISLEISF